MKQLHHLANIFVFAGLPRVSPRHRPTENSKKKALE